MTWKLIPGYDNYQVSDTGDVRNVNGTFITPWINNRGYLCVKLYKNGRRTEYKVHQLVMLTFKPDEKTVRKNEVHHKDFNKLNNNLDNLEWCTRKKNMKYNYEKKKICQTIEAVEEEGFF